MRAFAVDKRPAETGSILDLALPGGGQIIEAKS